MGSSNGCAASVDKGIATASCRASRTEGAALEPPELLLSDPELCWDATSDVASDATLPNSRHICVSDLLAAIVVMVNVYQRQEIYHTENAA